MNERTKTRALAILALLAVGVYSLCCKPAWSPDGDEVAYIFSESFGEHTTWGVAVYGVESKRSRVIVEQVADDKTALVPIEVFWPEARNELVIVSAPPDDSDRKDVVKVSTYSLQIDSITQEQEFEVPDVAPFSSIYPMHIEKDRYLWLCGEDGSYRLDLTGGGPPIRVGEAFVLRRNNKFYSVKQGPENEWILQRLTTFLRLRESPLFTIPCPEGHEIMPIFAMPEKHAWFACIDKSSCETTLRVFNDNGTVLDECTLPREFEFDDELLAGAAWSPDGSTLWLTVKGEGHYIGIAEIAIDAASLKQRLAFNAKSWRKARPLLSTIRFIKLDEGREDTTPPPLQLSLSPTGDWLAASFFTEEARQTALDVNVGAGLYLVELTGDERRVTLVPSPEPGALPKLSDAQ